MQIKLGVVDDHRIFLEGFCGLLESMQMFEVVMRASTGRLLQANMEDQTVLPDIIIIDTDMPVMNGLETTVWLQQHYPSIDLIAIAIDDRERAIIPMLKAGCCSFLFKVQDPHTLKKSLLKVYTNGYFNPDKIEPISFWPFHKSKKEENITLDSGELRFLQLACTDLSYEEILVEMNIGKKIGDRYAYSLFRKFGVTSRLGMVMEASRRESATNIST